MVYSSIFTHQVSLHAVPTSVRGVPYPGDNVTMEIRAEPGSLCAVGVVDRSIHVIEEPSYLSIEKVSACLSWSFEFSIFLGGKINHMSWSVLL